MVKREDGGILIELPKDLKRINRCVDYINTHPCKSHFGPGNRKYICISAYEDKKFSLAFLNDIKEPELIKAIYIDGRYDNYEVLYRFKELEELDCEFYEKDVLDLAKFPKLVELSPTYLYPLKNFSVPKIKRLYYGSAFDKVKVESELLKELTNLETLLFIGVTDFSFTEIGNMQNLRNVIFTQCNIRDFSGIEALKNLTYIDFCLCRSLKSIKGITQLPNLKFVCFDGCSRIEGLEEIAEIKTLGMLFLENMKKYDIEFVTRLKSAESLQCLALQHCGTLSSLKFLNNYPNLKAFYFYDTNVLDGDLTPCLKLETASTANKRHYNIKEDQLPFKHDIRYWANKF